MGVLVKGKVDPNVLNINTAKPEYSTGVIKRELIKYSVPQKVRFGMLPYSALQEYEQEKAATAAKAAEAAEEEAPKKRGTFWEEDEGDRQNISQEDFEKFLKDNAIDLSNINPLAGLDQ